mgnify:CR=1 FL=1
MVLVPVHVAGGVVWGVAVAMLVSAILGGPIPRVKP